MNKSAMETDHCKKIGENQTSFEDCSRLRTVKDSTNSNLHILASAPPILDGSNTGLKRGNDMGLGPQSTSQNIKLLVELPNLSTIRHYPYFFVFWTQQVRRRICRQSNETVLRPMIDPDRSCGNAEIQQVVAPDLSPSAHCRRSARAPDPAGPGH